MVGVSIDFLSVGQGSRSGDAIIVQYGTVDATELMVVDGGSRSVGKDAVSHITQYFGSQAVIQHMVCTHQDSDHASGLREIIENFKVKNLWVHQPWLFADELVDDFHHNWSADGLARHLREDAFPVVASLCDLAEEYGVPLRQPCQGATIGPFTVLAPSLERLLSLIPMMDQTPRAKQVSEASALESLFTVLKEAVLGTVEGWGIETLATPAHNATSVSNETSVVLHGDFDGGSVLLTGDAGVGALQDAIEGAALKGIVIDSPALIQIPHHGSRRNVSPAILDYILGKRLAAEGSRRGLAISTVADGATGHPRRVVENGFKRRGYDCFSTKGNAPWVNYYSGMPSRGGSPLAPAPFHTMVED